MGCREAIFVDKSTFDFPIFLLFFNANFPIFPIFSILSCLFSYFFEQPCRWTPWTLYQSNLPIVLCVSQWYYSSVFGAFLITIIKSTLNTAHCLYTAISRKVVGKSARDNPERYCGWFLVHCFSKKFQRMAREGMDVCLRVLKESNKVGSTATVSGTVYILPFGIVACTVVPTTFLEISVYNRPFYQYGGHIEFLRFKRDNKMPRGHSLSINARFWGKKRTYCIFLGKKAIITTSKHGTTIFFSHYNFF